MNCCFLKTKRQFYRALPKTIENFHTIIGNRTLPPPCLVAATLFAVSCDLETVPLEQDVITSAVVYDDQQLLQSRCLETLPGLALSGQEGPAGQPRHFGHRRRLPPPTCANTGRLRNCPPRAERSVLGSGAPSSPSSAPSWDADNRVHHGDVQPHLFRISLCNESSATDGGEWTAAKHDRATENQHHPLPRRGPLPPCPAPTQRHALDLFRKPPMVTRPTSLARSSHRRPSPRAGTVHGFIESESRP